MAVGVMLFFFAVSWVGLQCAMITHTYFFPKEKSYLYSGFLVARFEVIATDKKQLVTNIFHTITHSLCGIIETGFSMKSFDELGQCK